MAEAPTRMVCPDCGLHYRAVADATGPGQCLRCQGPLVPLRRDGRSRRIGLPPLQDELHPLSR